MLVENRPELRPHHTVDHQVDGGVKDKEDMIKESQGNVPDREATKVSVLTPVDILDDGNLVHVEDQPGEITNEKDCNNEHEDNGQVVVTSSSSLPDGDVYLGVQIRDGGEGDQAKNKKPCPVDVPGDIHIIHPEICHIQVLLGGVSILVGDH